MRFRRFRSFFKINHRKKIVKLAVASNEREVISAEFQFPRVLDLSVHKIQEVESDKFHLNVLANIIKLLMRKGCPRTYIKILESPDLCLFARESPEKMNQNFYLFSILRIVQVNSTSILCLMSFSLSGPVTSSQKPIKTNHRSLIFVVSSQRSKMWTMEDCSSIHTWWGLNHVMSHLFCASLFSYRTWSVKRKTCIDLSCHCSVFLGGFPILEEFLLFLLHECFVMFD